MRLVRAYFVIAVTSCLVALIFAAEVSSAHFVSDYRNTGTNGWKYTILDRVYNTPQTNWSTAYNTPTDNAMARWTGVPGSNLSFQRGGQAPQGAWACGASYDNLRAIDIPGMGLTETCVAENSTVRITIDSNRTWYTGTATPNPSGTYDFDAVMTHELGHAHQAWIGCTNGADNDPCPGAHYDPNHNGLICNSSDLMSWHTMCGGANPPPLLGTTDHWRARSLETHDKDLVENMY